MHKTVEKADITVREAGKYSRDQDKAAFSVGVKRDGDQLVSSHAAKRHSKVSRIRTQRKVPLRILVMLSRDLGIFFVEILAGKLRKPCVLLSQARFLSRPQSLRSPTLRQGCPPVVTSVSVLGCGAGARTFNVWSLVAVWLVCFFCEEYRPSPPPCTLLRFAAKSRCIFL